MTSFSKRHRQNDIFSRKITSVAEQESETSRPMCSHVRRIQNGSEIPYHVTYTIISLFRRMTQPGPSLTIWDREGNFKECKRKPEDFTSGLSFYLKRLPGRRFALIQKTAFGHGAILRNIYVVLPYSDIIYHEIYHVKIMTRI